MYHPYIVFKHSSAALNVIHELMLCGRHRRLNHCPKGTVFISICRLSLITIMGTNVKMLIYIYTAYLCSNKVNDPTHVSFHILILRRHEVIYIYCVTHVVFERLRMFNIMVQLSTSCTSLTGCTGRVSGRYITAIINEQALASAPPEFAREQGVLGNLLEAHEVPQVDVDASLDEIGDSTA